MAYFFPKHEAFLKPQIVFWKIFFSTCLKLYCKCPDMFAHFFKIENNCAIVCTLVRARASPPLTRVSLGSSSEREAGSTTIHMIMCARARLLVFCTALVFLSWALNWTREMNANKRIIKKDKEKASVMRKSIKKMKIRKLKEHFYLQIFSI